MAWQFACGPAVCVWSDSLRMTCKLVCGSTDCVWPGSLRVTRQLACGPAVCVWFGSLRVVRQIACGPAACVWTCSLRVVRQSACGLAACAWPTNLCVIMQLAYGSAVCHVSSLPLQRPTPQRLPPSRRLIAHSPGHRQAFHHKPGSTVIQMPGRQFTAVFDLPLAGLSAATAFNSILQPSTRPSLRATRQLASGHVACVWFGSLLVVWQLAYGLPTCV